MCTDGATTRFTASVVEVVGVALIRQFVAWRIRGAMSPRKATRHEKSQPDEGSQQAS
jgi:hypothetical protein